MNNIFFGIIKDINNENDKSKSTFQQYKWDYNLEEDKDDDNIFSFKHHHRKSSNSSIISNNNRINALKFASTNERSLPSSPSYSSSSSSSNSPNPFKSSQGMSKKERLIFLEEINSKLNNNDELSHSSLRKIKSSLFGNESYQNNNEQLFKTKSMISLPSSSTINDVSDSTINENTNPFHKKNLFNIEADDIVSRNINQNLSLNEFNNKDLSNRHVPPTPIIDADNPFIESSTKIKRMFEKKNLFNILPKNEDFQSQSTLLNFNNSDDSDSSCPPSPLISRTPLRSKSTKNSRESSFTVSLTNIDNDSDSDAPYKHTRNYSKRMEQMNKNGFQNKKSNKINYTNNNPSKTTIINLNETVDNNYTSNNSINFVYNTRSRSKQNINNNKKNEKNDISNKGECTINEINKKTLKSKTNNLGMKSQSIPSPLMKENNDTSVNDNFKYTQLKKYKSLSVASLNSPNTKIATEKKNKNIENQELLGKTTSTNDISKIKTNSSINNINKDQNNDMILKKNEMMLPELKSQKSNLSFSTDNFNNDPFHVSSLSNQNLINDKNTLSSTPPLNSNNQHLSQIQQIRTPTKNTVISSQDDTTKTEKSLLSSTSNFVNMMLLPKKTPQKTPSSKRRNSMCGDRFIPNYSSGDKETQYNLAGPITPSKGKRKLPPGECDAVKEEQNKIYDSVVKIELLGQDMYDNPLDKINRHRTSVYSFKTPKKRTYQMMDADSPTQHKYSLTPVSQASQNLLLTPRKATRHISKTPYKVLDAPELQVY